MSPGHRTDSGSDPLFVVSDHWPLDSAQKAVLGALKVVFIVFCPLDFGFSGLGP
jgi:tRNA pseudouridine-54 N-methylase